MSWDDRSRSVLRRVAAAMTGALLLASCGGGDLVERFVPERVLSFGDENSVIESSNGIGVKYTINFQTDAAASIDCTQLAIWNQIVASSYGLPFDKCPGTATSTRSRILAVPNAGVAGVTQQIDNFLNPSTGEKDSFGGHDLVTVMAGLHDIVDLQTQIGVNGYTFDNAKADASAAGIALASQVNRIVEAGGKVLIATVPRVGYTPYGRADATRASQLNELTDQFNDALRFNIINDGRRIGLVLADQNIRTVVEAASLNVSEAACTATPVTSCTSQTLKTGATPSTWLWADDLHLSPAGHSSIGSLAVARATGNPF